MNSILTLFHRPVQTLGHVLSLFWPGPVSSPKSALDYDQLSAEGPRLREAIAVRSAEFWLALGEPRVALNELESLSNVAKQNAWLHQVRRHAVKSRQSCAE